MMRDYLIKKFFCEVKSFILPGYGERRRRVISLRETYSKAYS